MANTEIELAFHQFDLEGKGFVLTEVRTSATPAAPACPAFVYGAFPFFLMPPTFNQACFVEFSNHE